MIAEIHGIPIIIQDIDDEDRKIGGVNRSYKELRQDWINYISNSEAVKKQATKIRRLEIGTLAHFYWKDAKLRFHCNKYNQTTCLERCQDGCIDWSMDDMICSGSHMGKDVDITEKSKSLALDTMHVLRIVLQ